MYQIKCDDVILDDPRDDELTVINPRLTLEINMAGSLTFRIYPSHPYFDRVKKLSSVMQVYKSGKLIYKGRVTDDAQDIDNAKAVECEGKLACLNDSAYRAFDFQGPPDELFRSFLSNHNAQVCEDQRLKPGRVTVTDPNNYIRRSSEEYINTWEAVNTRLLETLGGYLFVRYEEDGDYLDWLADFEKIATQPIQAGKNLLDINNEVSVAETYTAMIPLGAELGNGKRIDITSVNGGLDYIINQEAVERYGAVIYAPRDLSTWEDVTLPENLLTKARSYLSQTGIKMKATLEISAIDLHLTDAEIESFDFCDYVRVLSKIHGVDQYFLLSKMDLDLSQPQNTRLTLGESKLSYADIQLGADRHTYAITQRVDAIEKQYLTQANVDGIIEQKTEEKISESLADYVSYDRIIAGSHIQINRVGETLSVAADWPENVSQMQNDAGYQTGQQVQELIHGSLPETGVSPTIIETIKSDSEYILTISDINGSYSTPNLKGPAGAAGVNATIRIGTVVTGDPGSRAEVTNSGTDTAAVLDLKIPKGEKGDAGAGGGSSLPDGRDGQILQYVNGAWSGSDVLGDVRRILDNINGEVI